MSRIGSLPIAIPDGVEVKVQGNAVHVKGPKGSLERSLPAEMLINISDNELVVERPSDSKEDRAMHGLIRKLIANMVEGVVEGFTKELQIQGVGYRAAMQGKKLVLSVGYSHPVEIETPEGMEIEVKSPTEIVVKGIDKERVGELAANIRSVRSPEPYLGKGIRYKGEYVRRKAGKAGKVSQD